MVVNNNDPEFLFMVDMRSPHPRTAVLQTEKQLVVKAKDSNDAIEKTLQHFYLEIDAGRIHHLSVSVIECRKLIDIVDPELHEARHGVYDYDYQHADSYRKHNVHKDVQALFMRRQIEMNNRVNGRQDNDKT